MYVKVREQTECNLIMCTLPFALNRNLAHQHINDRCADQRLTAIWWIGHCCRFAVGLASSFVVSWKGEVVGLLVATENLIGIHLALGNELRTLNTQTDFSLSL